MYRIFHRFPIIPKFYGIIIKMYFFGSEHNPLHVHVIFGEYIGVINIRTLAILHGELPDKAYRLAKEWVTIYQNELLNMWETQNIHHLPPMK